MTAALMIRDLCWDVWVFTRWKKKIYEILRISFCQPTLKLWKWKIHINTHAHFYFHNGQFHSRNSYNSFDQTGSKMQLKENGKKAWGSENHFTPRKQGRRGPPKEEQRHFYSPKMTGSLVYYWDATLYPPTS